MVLGVRPETLRLVAGGSGDLDATVEFVEELGASRVLHLEWAGQMMAVLQTEPTSLQPGDVAGVIVPRVAQHLFAAASGERLPDNVEALDQREAALV